MWRNDAQACRAIVVLLKPLPTLRQLWTENGPTELALHYLEVIKDDHLSSEEIIMLRASFDLWSSEGQLKLNEISGTLDRAHAVRLFALIVAACDGADAVDRWIAHEESPEREITVEVDDTVFSLLEVLTKGGIAAPQSVQGVVDLLIDHAQQGIYRPGSWERGWLTQVFGEDWTDFLMPGDPYGRPNCHLCFEKPKPGVQP